MLVVHIHGTRTTMNLEVWLPAVFLLGLATMALLFAFLAACEKV